MYLLNKMWIQISAEICLVLTKFSTNFVKVVIKSKVWSKPKSSQQKLLSLFYYTMNPESNIFSSIYLHRFNIIYNVINLLGQRRYIYFVWLKSCIKEVRFEWTSSVFTYIYIYICILWYCNRFSLLILWYFDFMLLWFYVTMITFVTLSWYSDSLFRDVVEGFVPMICTLILVQKHTSVFQKHRSGQRRTPQVC